MSVWPPPCLSVVAPLRELLPISLSPPSLLHAHQTSPSPFSRFLPCSPCLVPPPPPPRLPLPCLSLPLPRLTVGAPVCLSFPLALSLSPQGQDLGGSSLGEKHTQSGNSTGTHTPGRPRRSERHRPGAEVLGSLRPGSCRHQGEPNTGVGALDRVGGGVSVSPSPKTAAQSPKKRAGSRMSTSRELRPKPESAGSC